MTLATQAQIALHLDLTPRSVAELLARGVLPPARRGSLDLDRCRVSYLRHLRAIAAGRGAEYGKLDLVAERARLAKEQADAKALANAQARGDLIPRADFEEAVIALCSGVTRHLSGVPTRAAPEARIATSDALAEAVIREHLDQALTELADAGDAIGERVKVRQADEREVQQ